MREKKKENTADTLTDLDTLVRARSHTHKSAEARLFVSSSHYLCAPSSPPRSSCFNISVCGAAVLSASLLQSPAAVCVRRWPARKIIHTQIHELLRPFFPHHQSLSLSPSLSDRPLIPSTSSQLPPNCSHFSSLSLQHVLLASCLVLTYQSHIPGSQGDRG